MSGANNNTLGMTCQEFHHVGQLFPFPAGWSGATGAVQCLDGVAWINGVGYSTTGVRASVARKQSFLSALEMGFLMGVVKRFPGSADVDEDYDFSTYSPDLDPSLATPAGRAALVNRRRMMPTGCLQAIPGILSLMKSMVTHGLFDYYPPGNAPLSAAYGVLNADFTLYSNQSGVEDVMEGFDIYNGGTGYAGFEDFTTWPVFEDGGPNVARLMLWAAIQTFLGSTFNILGRIRSYLGMSSPWGSAQNASVLMSDLHSNFLGTTPPPPKMSDVHPRRLASLMQALYEHALSRIGSQEVVMRDYARIPHYEARLEAVLTIEAEYSMGDDPLDPEGATPPTFTILEKSMNVTTESITGTYGLDYVFNLPYDMSVGLDPLADTFRCSSTITGADFTGRGTPGGSGGASWLELTTDDLIAVAQSDPGVYHPRWVRRGTPGEQGSFTLRCTFDYKTPFENLTALHVISENPAVATSGSDLCAALGWLTARQAFCSFLAKGEVTSAGNYIGNDDFMASAGATNQDAISLIRQVMSKVSDGVADGENWFAHSDIDMGWMARQFSLESDQAILNQLSGLSPSHDVVALYSKYRIPISGCSWQGLQALHDPSNDLWGEPRLTEDGSELVLLTETFGASGGDVDWLRMPSWISQTVKYNNPELSASADLFGVASYEAVPYGTRQQNS